METLALKSEPRVRDASHSVRLKQVRDEAANVRRQLQAGSISLEEATRQLNELVRRNATIFSRVFDF